MKEKEEKQKTDYSKENKQRMLAALAVLIGLTDDASEDGYAKLSPEQKELVQVKYDNAGLSKTVETSERILERDVQIKAAETGMADGAVLYKIATAEDEKVCEHCAAWAGKVVSMSPNPFGYPTVQDFINDHGFHINCRCSLQELDTTEIPRKQKLWFGLNSTSDLAVKSGVYCQIS